MLVLVDLRAEMLLQFRSHRSPERVGFSASERAAPGEVPVALL